MCVGEGVCVWGGGVGCFVTAGAAPWACLRLWRRQVAVSLFGIGASKKESVVLMVADGRVDRFTGEELPVHTPSTLRSSPPPPHPALSCTFARPEAPPPPDCPRLRVPPRGRRTPRVSTALSHPHFWEAASCIVLHPPPPLNHYHDRVACACDAHARGGPGAWVCASLPLLCSLLHTVRGSVHYCLCCAAFSTRYAKGVEETEDLHYDLRGMSVDAIAGACVRGRVWA